LECTSPQTIYGLVATERVAKNPKIKEIWKFEIHDCLLFYST
jgi:hypothetical protein